MNAWSNMPKRHLNRCGWGAAGGHEATDTELAYAPVSQAHGHHHTQFTANQISSECCLAFATPGGYRNFLGCLGQLAPTTLPQRRLVSNLSLCGPLSLSVHLSLRPPKGVCLPLRPPKGVSLPFRPPYGFLSVPLFPCSLPRLNPPPLCLPVLLRRTAVRTAACSATCRGGGGGHEATETGLAYAPVSQEHCHNHIVQCFACCTAA